MALTITSRGTGTHNTGATTLVPGGRNATLAVGSLGVLCIALDNAGANGNTLIAPASWTDAKGNVWTERLDALFDNGAASAGIEMAIYTAPITVALLTTDAGTITWDTGVSPVAKAWTWYEVIPSNGITPAFLNAGSIAGATAANAQVVTAESINIGDGVIAGYFSENVAAVTQDSDSTNGSWTAQQTATVGTTTSGVRIATQQKVQTTAASTQSYDVTVSSQDRIAGYISVREVQAKTPAPTAASLTAAGVAPTVTATDNKAAAPTAASLTATGATATVTATANQLAEPTAAALTTTGATPAISLPIASAPTTAALVASGATPTLGAGLDVPAASLSVTGDTPSVLAPAISEPTAGSLTTTGATPAIALPIAVAPDAVALSTTPETPEVKTPVVTEPDAASLTLATETPDILTPVAVDPDAVELVLTGATPVVQAGSSNNIEVVPDAGALEATGSTPTVTATANVRVLPTWPHPLDLGGAAPSVEAGASWSLTPVPAGLTITGARPSVQVGGIQDSFVMEQVPIRLIPVVRSRPRAASLGLVGSAPRIVVGDDADVLEILRLIA